MIWLRLAMVLALCAPLAAQADIVTYKDWPHPTDDIRIPHGTGNAGYVSVGYPQDTTFVKLRDDTAIRCQLGADFTPERDGTIGVAIFLDDHLNASVGVTGLTGQWIAPFFGHTFIPHLPGTGPAIPAGPHKIEVQLQTWSTPVTFYARYASLQCFEEALGVAQ